jgi:hypothetical protein
MLWAIVLIGTLIAFLKFPIFRKSMIVIAVVLALIILGYLENEKLQTEASKNLVRFDQLEFADMRLGPESYGSSYRLTGRIKNNSPYSVFGIKAKVHVLDCDEKSHCDVIGEEEESIGPLIPPGQVRDIDDSIYFSGATHVKGQFQWNYTISEIQGRH